MIFAQTISRCSSLPPPPPPASPPNTTTPTPQTTASPPLRLQDSTCKVTLPTTRLGVRLGRRDRRRHQSCHPARLLCIRLPPSLFARPRQRFRPVIRQPGLGTRSRILPPLPFQRLLELLLPSTEHSQAAQASKCLGRRHPALGFFLGWHPARQRCLRRHFAFAQCLPQHHGAQVSASQGQPH